MNFHIKKHIAVRVLCWILLLQSINLSIDAPDLTPITHTSLSDNEDLLVNDIESIYELVSEVIFGKDVPENDENDIDTKSPVFDAFCFSPQSIIQNISAYLIDCESHYLGLLIFDSPEPDFPPPRRIDRL